MTNTMTRKEALTIAIAAVEDARAKEVLEHMLTKLTEPKKAAYKPKPETLQFREDVFDLLNSGDKAPMTNKQVATYLNVSTQKSSSALRALVKDGRVVRNEPEIKKEPATFAVA